MTTPLALAFAALIVALGIVWKIVRRLDAELTAMIAQAEANDGPVHGSVGRDELVDQARTRYADAANRPNGMIAVVALEIADLASIRSSLGHIAADHVVAEVLQRLRATTRDREELACVGDDRFLLMLNPPMTPYGALRAASRLSETMAHPLTVDDVALQVQIHAGTAVGPASEADAVFDNAEFALGRARQLGQTTPVLYDETEREQAEVAFRRAQGLRTAIEHDEMHVAYQPIPDLETGRLSGAEALLRWDSRALGPVSPADFIPIAETTGAIVEIGGWVLEQACHDVQTMAADCGQPTVAVNVSVQQLRHQGFVDIVRTALIASGLEPGRLTLEVTESIFANPVEVTAALDRLRDLGVRVALDDVGTGYSSLAQLATLPIDVMKLDRSLLSGGIGSGEATARVFTSVAALGRSLGLDVVAEGVETEAQSTFAQRAGCTHEQGFLRSRPVPIAEAVAFAQRLSSASPTR